jgi:exonuclease SbcC
MLPLRLEIRNFLAYRAPDALVFDGIRLACLTGANGAGKSSLLDAITWALWGEARANADDLIHQGQSEMLVALKFEQDGLIFEVIRRRGRRKSSGTTELEFYAILENGERIARSEASVRATQAAIDALLRLDYETFTRSAFLKQGGADAFTKLSPADRKKTLAKILGLDRFERYEASAKARSQTLNGTIDRLLDDIANTERELASEPAKRAALDAAEAAYADADAALIDAEKRLAEVQSAPDLYQAALASKAAHEKRRAELERDLSAARVDAERAAVRVRAAQGLIDAAEEIEAGFAAYQTAIQTEKDLATRLSALREVDERINVCEREIAAALSALQADAARLTAQIEGLRRQIDAAQPEKLAALEADAAALERAEAEREALNLKLTTLEAESAALKARNDALDNERTRLRRRLKSLQQIQGGECPECGQPLTDEHRDAMIAAITEEGVGYKNESEANKARLTALVEETAATDAALKALRAEIRRLMRIKEDAAKLSQQAETAAAAARELTAAQVDLDALSARIDTGDFAHDARAALDAARVERAAIGYDDALHEQMRADLERLNGYQQRHFELSAARAALPAYQADLASAEERIARAESAAAEVDAALIAVESDLAALAALVETFKARDAEVNRLRAATRDARDRVTIARQELNALMALRSVLDKQRGDLAATREEKAIYDELQFAFSKKGIPAMIIETAIPELEAAANDLLGRMTNGRMSLKLETQREKKSSDGVIETLDIQIADELGTRRYELFSGGESFRIDFALRIALSQLLARRAGAQLQTLFIDEGFGTQDDDGRDRLIEAITAIQDEFNLILVITHIEELRDSFPVHILIDKVRGDGSRIRVL